MTKKSRRVKAAVDAAMAHSSDQRLQRSIDVLEGRADPPVGVTRRDWAMAVLRGNESDLEGGTMGRGPR